MKKPQFPKPCDTCPHNSLKTLYDTLRCNRCERFRAWFAGQQIRANKKALVVMRENRLKWLSEKAKR